MIHTARSLNEVNPLAQAIVNTIREPLLVLDADLRVLAASGYFYETFRVEPAQTEGSLLYALGDGLWDIPALRLLLGTIIVDRTEMDGFEVEHDFPKIGHRIMLRNARRVLYEAALKYAFPQPKPEALILVRYETADTDWVLVVSDNGAGKAIASAEDAGATKGGLGTAIVKALAKQLEARMEVSSNPGGLTVSITHATFTSRRAGAQ